MIRSASTALLARLLPLLGGAMLAACGARTDPTDFQGEGGADSAGGSDGAGGSAGAGGSGASGGAPATVLPPLCAMNFCGGESCYFVSATAKSCVSASDPALATLLPCPNTVFGGAPMASTSGGVTSCCYAAQCLGTGRPLVMDEVTRVSGLRGRRDWASSAGAPA